MRTLCSTVLLLSIAIILSSTALNSATPQASASDHVQRLKITLLSTMLADGEELGEWGFSALVEVDGHRILFDTGAHSDVVLKNARGLGIDLSTIPDVVLSHSHSDHVGGLLTLHESVRTEKPEALGRTHVGAGMFYSRWSIRPGIEENPMIAIKAEYEKRGGVFISHDKPEPLYPGVWLTGPIPRKYPERNWSGAGKVVTPDGVVEDNLPEDMALVFNTDAGLVVLCGCGHAGVINTLEYAQTMAKAARIHALIGGIHLFSANEKTLGWTSEKLSAFGLDYLIGAHCTGIEPVYRFRHDLGLDRKHAVVGAVGASFELNRGIDPRAIAR